MRLRVLHVLASLDQKDGGPLRAVLDLSAAGFAYGLESEILGPGPIAIADNPMPPGLLHAPARPLWHTYRYTPGLRRWLRANLRRFDGVIIHGMWLYPNLVPALECRRASVPYACFPHGMLDHYTVNGMGVFKRLKKHAYWHLVERHVYRGSVAVLFTTNRELQHAQQVFPVENKKLLVVPYGVSGPCQKPDHPASGAIEQPKGRRVALFLGRVHPKKNVNFLIAAWNATALAPDYHLVVAGPCEEKYLSRLKRLAEAGPHRDRIHFVGYVAGQDKAYLLGRAQWFLLPSHQENFGLAVLEAVRQNCAVAISDEVYLADYLRPESEVLPLSAEAWVEFFEQRMTDDDHRDRTASEDAAHLRAVISLDTVQKNWVRAMEELFPLRTHMQVL